MLLLNIYDPVTRKLLFQYDPINNAVWTKQKNGRLHRTNLHIVIGEHAGQIEAYLSTMSTDPVST